MGVDESDAQCLGILDLAVRPDARRRGIGRALLEHLHQHFKPVAMTGHTLALAVVFYEACGFTVVADGEMPNGETRYRFDWSRTSADFSA